MVHYIDQFAKSTTLPTPPPEQNRVERYVYWPIYQVTTNQCIVNYNLL